MVRAAMTGDAGQAGRLAGRQCDTVGWLRERVAVVEAERRALRAERDRLAGTVKRLQARVDALTAQVEELRRAGKRQAAPFSRDRPSSSPRRPGRKAGAAYGRHGRRPVPGRVDRVVAVGLPDACPWCGGELRVERVACQDQEDLPPPRQTEVCCYEVAVGRCRSCRRRIQPRHPEQTSDALGAAAVQLGPRAVALAAWASKGLGLPAGKVARLLGQLGLRVTPGGVGQAVARAARRCQPTYQALVAGVTASPAVAPDETGWRVAGLRAWLWAFAGQGITVYRIAGHRGFDDAKVVLGRGSRACWSGTGGRRTARSPRRPPDVPGAPAAPCRRAAGRRQARAGQDPARHRPDPPAGPCGPRRPRRRRAGPGRGRRR